jgi:hypothetical protein
LYALTLNLILPADAAQSVPLGRSGLTALQSLTRKSTDDRLIWSQVLGKFSLLSLYAIIIGWRGDSWAHFAADGSWLYCLAERTLGIGCRARD